MRWGLVALAIALAVTVARGPVADHLGSPDRGARAASSARGASATLGEGSRPQPAGARGCGGESGGCTASRYRTIAIRSTLHHAGIVIRHGDGTLTYAYVAFPEGTISGIELLRRSGIPVVTVSFGGLGEAVCSLGDEGCPASTCRRRVCQGAGDASPFWQYFRQAKPGDWRPLALGASATKVHDGDVDGWSWTAHEARLPALTVDDVARLAGAPAGTPSLAAPLIPTAAVRTIAPPGVTPQAAAGRQGLVTYLAAGGVIAVIAAAAIGVAGSVRRRARRSGA